MNEIPKLSLSNFNTKECTADSFLTTKKKKKYFIYAKWFEDFEYVNGFFFRFIHFLMANFFVFHTDMLIEYFVKCWTSFIFTFEISADNRFCLFNFFPNFFICYDAFFIIYNNKTLCICFFFKFSSQTFSNVYYYFNVISFLFFGVSRKSIHYITMNLLKEQKKNLIL